MASWFSTLNKDPYGTLNPEQVQVNKGLGSTLLNQATNPNAFNYGGQLNANMGTGEQDVIDRNARMNAVASQTYGTLGNYNEGDFNKQFADEISNPTFDNFKNNISPYLAQELPSFGTQRANVIARSLGDLQNNVLQQRFTAREAAKDRALSAVGQSADYLGKSAQIQAVPREIQQAGLDRQYNAFTAANASKQNAVNQALQFLGISTGSVTQEPTTLGNVATLGTTVANIIGAIKGMGNGGTNPTPPPSSSTAR